MDGLLIDSEDKYTDITNDILQQYGKPLLPWSIKAQLQGRAAPEVCGLATEARSVYICVLILTHWIDYSRKGSS